MALMSDLDIPMAKLERLALYGVMCDLYVWIRCYIRGNHTCRMRFTFCRIMPMYGYIRTYSQGTRRSRRRRFMLNASTVITR